ncbi:hypothetical protein Ahy_A07g033072 [Arachis hypogaea]|uniref:beta-ketoacyl-[acyl-carrier-protein] synthase I n=1 Tax=Arachis hypogaea TaxID=3818 RepID=A0A445C846_ARAHY|nr:hypothetical protein Ahy_A07g033072 [Arachis hypogaea]
MFCYILALDVMLCGGSDVAIIPIGLGGFVACKSLSQRNTDPTKALRPWDIAIYDIPEPRWICHGEGPGVLLLEDLEHAKVFISFAKILLQVTRPRTCILGNIPRTIVYRNIHQYPEASKVPAVTNIDTSGIHALEEFF